MLMPVSYMMHPDMSLTFSMMTRSYPTSCGPALVGTLALSSWILTCIVMKICPLEIHRYLRACLVLLVLVVLFRRQHTCIEMERMVCTR